MNGNDLKYSLVVLLFIFLVELLMFTLCFEHLSSSLNISLVLHFSVRPDCAASTIETSKHVTIFQ